MKKIIALFAAAFILCSCHAGGPAPGENSLPEGVKSEENTDIGSEMSEISAAPGDTPVVTGNFIQPFAILSFDENRMTRHLTGLLEAGIDTVILQWSSMTPYGAFADVYFHYEGGDDYKSPDYSDRYSGMTEILLSSAEKLGMKVFIGLNNADEWWSKGPSDKAWNIKQAEAGIVSARQIYSQYKKDFPRALHGWYYVWEMSNGNIMRWPEENAEMLNRYLDELTAIDPSMPLMLSPFISEADGSADELGESLKRLLQKANFRRGDIYCCQDSVGAGYMRLSKLPEYFAAVGEAVKTKDGLLFWANNENFVQETWRASSLDRFIRQMDAASDYVSGYVTFSYTHYYSPDIAGTPVYHDAYIRYLETGALPENDKPGTPEIQADLISGRDALSVSVLAAQNTYGVESVSLQVNGEEYKTAVNGNVRDGAVYKTSFYIDLSAYAKGETLLIQVCAYDATGTPSDIASLSYTKGENGD